MRIPPGNFATIAVGLVFVAIGIYTWLQMGRFIDNAGETTAVVIEVLNESATPKGRTHPVVRFTTPDGREVVARSNEHHNVKPADTVQVVYDAGNPEFIKITTLERLQRQRILFAGLALAVGLTVCWVGFRQRVV